MKKFCNRIAKPQWRVTVPNFNFKLKEEPIITHPSSKRSSGSYDLQEAQVEYDKTRSVPHSVYISDSASSSSDEEAFEDANEMRKQSDEESEDELLYTDVIVTRKIESSNLNAANSQFEYDVPKISFKFFERKLEDYQTSSPVKSEIKIVLETPPEEEETPHKEDPPVDLYETPPNSGRRRTSQKVEEAPLEVYETPRITYEQTEDTLEAPAEYYETPKPPRPSESPSPEKFVSQTEINFQNTIKAKCGSDPNILQDDFYQIPRAIQQTHRLSHSLTDFDPETTQPLTPDHASIEHISCSQIITIPEEPTSSKGKSRLPIRIRKVNLLKKQKKAMDKWNNLKTKFHTKMSEHAAQQRVGAFNEKEKITINFEEMYKNSKSKCKKMFESTGKMFKNRRINGDNSNSVPKMELTASDIVYKLNTDEEKSELKSDCDSSSICKLKEDEFGTVRSALKRNKSLSEGQNGFEELRRYIKQGGDFCKELATILQERAEAETQYAKSLSKLSCKLSRACRDGVGGLNEAWKAVAKELEDRAESHRLMGNALLEETAKPLRTLTESQHRVRKSSETAVDKAARLVAEWRVAEAKGKKQSHTCARDNEKLQDVAVLDTSKYGKLTLSRSTSLIQLAHMHNKTASDKDTAKLEGKKKKAEDAVKKADVEYYALCVRAERARLEWESAVLRGVSTFQSLEEERLTNLKSVLTSYLHHNNEHGPRLIEATEKLKTPISQGEPTKDLSAFLNLRQSSQQISEQLLPDFYCEHITLAMNRERRKQALVKLLHLIRQDIERERKSKNGLEKLSRAIKQTPNFGAEDSQQSVTEKLYHMKSMLTYLEGARYKVQNALAELDSRPRSGHPLAPHITITRDKSGLQQSVLKVPQWLKEEWHDSDRSPVSEKSGKSNQSDNSDPHVNEVDDPDWLNRGAADGNSNQPDSDFDEFSSQCSSINEENPVVPIAKCKALYIYTPNLVDELALKPGDVLSVYRQQDDGWWLGECNGNVGIFPATYVEIIPAKDCK